MVESNPLRYHCRLRKVAASSSVLVMVMVISREWCGQRERTIAAQESADSRWTASRECGATIG